MIFVAECLKSHAVEVLRVCAFEFNHGFYNALKHNRAVRFLCVGFAFVFQLGQNVVIRLWFYRVAQTRAEQIADKAFLILLLFAFADICLFFLAGKN